jgi:hypothetical protein
MKNDEEVPQHFKKSKKKSYGIKISRNYIRWYETEKARDQAFEDIPKHKRNSLKEINKKHGMIQKYKKVER